MPFLCASYIHDSTPVYPGAHHGLLTMNVPINVKRLRATLPDVVARVRKGTRFTVIYRSRPAFQIVPVADAADASVSLAEDPLYRARGQRPSNRKALAQINLHWHDLRHDRGRTGSVG